MERIQETIQDFINQKVQEEGYSGALIGLSGGIDSTNVAYLATNALGTSNVLGLTLTFPEQIREDFKDSKEIAKHLGIEQKVIDISSLITAHGGIIPREIINNRTENPYLTLFERINSTISLSWADTLNYLVLSSTNKTEFLTSFYSIGGNIGHIFPLGDLYKTEVRKLAETLGIPKKIVTKVSRDGFMTRKSDEEIIGVSYEDIDRICYGIEFWEEPLKIEERTGISLAKIYEIQKRIKDSERKLSFPICNIASSKRKDLLGRKNSLQQSSVTHYCGG